MSPTPAQAAAIKAIVDWYLLARRGLAPQIFYLAGYAGTGKSTIFAWVVEELKSRFPELRIRTAAYTGKAASVLRKKGIIDAITTHGLMYVVVEDEETGKLTFKLDLVLAPAARADLIALDEVSMFPDFMGEDLEKFGKPILVMGDPGQLPPPKGTGAYTLRKPDIFLTEVHRQAAESPILRLATMARKGEPILPGEYSPDVKVLRLTKGTAEEIYRPDTMPICGIHRTRHAMTALIRQRRGFDARLPQKGERIICRRNDRDTGIFNGQLGTALSDADTLYPDGPFKFDVTLEDRDGPLTELPVHPWLFAQHYGGQTQRPRIPRGLHEFDWGNVLTGHLAQGSEFQHVTAVDDSRAFREEAPRWLYTVLTRPIEGLTLLQRN